MNGKSSSASPARRPSAANSARQIEETLGDTWLPRIYRERIRKMRTRAYHLGTAARNVRVQIQHTLLGVELKVGRRRMLCPDQETARYLAVFARAGCEAVALPYDITKISPLADELESSWHRMLLLAEQAGAERSPAFQTRIRALLIGKVRAEVAEAGAGARMPEFEQSTRQTDKPRKGTRSLREKR